MISQARQHEQAAGAGRRNGFTLIEMVVTVAVMSVIMLGVGSAMIIASHAMPTADNPAAATIAASQVAEQITTELQYAVSIIVSNATAIEFTVSDRDGDDVREIIRYEWSGTPGAPLIRQYNNAAPISVLDNVYKFNLAYDLKTTTTETPQGNESPETLLKSFGSNDNLADYLVKDTEWYSQYFLPSLPADTVSWSVTRIRFEAKSDGTANGECKVQLQLPTSDDLPSTVVLEEKTLLESTLSSAYATQEFRFTGASGLSPEEGLCLVFRWISSSTAARIRGQDQGADPSNSTFLKSTNDGTSWSARGGESLLFRIYGAVTTEGQPQIESTYYLDRVDIKLQPRNADQTIVQTGVKAFNRPEVIQ